MAKQDKMAAFRDRMRKQMAEAHLEPEIPDSSQPTIATTTPGATPEQSPAAMQAVEVAAPRASAAQRRHRSKWANPYPEVVPFQTSVYLTEEDIIRIKSLRLKLHFAREWMVLKYALVLQPHVRKRDGGKVVQ
jgi:hypothetical protein